MTARIYARSGKAGVVLQETYRDANAIPWMSIPIGTYVLYRDNVGAPPGGQPMVIGSKVSHREIRLFDDLEINVWLEEQL